jgi:hypothetical protein
MVPEQHEPSTDAAVEIKPDPFLDMCYSLVERYYLPRQRGGTAASRRAWAEAEFVASLPRILGGGHADGVEGTGK